MPRDQTKPGEKEPGNETDLVLFGSTDDHLVFALQQVLLSQLNCIDLDTNFSMFYIPIYRKYFYKLSAVPKGLQLSVRFIN